MADTIVTNSPDRATDNTAAAWAIAVVVILAVIVGAVFLYRNTSPGVPNTGNDINVTLPTDSGTGGTGGATQ